MTPDAATSESFQFRAYLPATRWSLLSFNLLARLWVELTIRELLHLIEVCLNKLTKWHRGDSRGCLPPRARLVRATVSLNQIFSENSVDTSGVERLNFDLPSQLNPMLLYILASTFVRDFR